MKEVVVFFFGRGGFIGFFWCLLELSREGVKKEKIQYPTDAEKY